MQLIQKQTEKKLGFTEIRRHLSGLASTDDGKEACLAISPFPDPGSLCLELGLVVECRDLFAAEEGFLFDFTGSVRELIQESQVGGSWLTEAELFRFYKWWKMVGDLLRYFGAKREKYPLLSKMVTQYPFGKELLKALEKILDDRGNIRDSNASDKLSSLRKEQAGLLSDLRKILNRVLQHAISKGWAQESSITLRNDRLVIPLSSDFKGRIKGFVHDVSQSGQTLYLEPQEALEANNQIRRIAAEEQNEIKRILREVTARIGENAGVLFEFVGIISHLDLLRAKARMAHQLDAHLPVFDPEGDVCRLVKARHPLLLLKAGKHRDEVIPLSIELNPGQRIILVSGPNAGGKSVTLKTIGLLQLMFQSGLLVPASDASEFRWFERMFIDIGDEQSIQSDLSTYTSHLSNMNLLLRNLDQNSLFLIDEFGSGTDPKLGGAMAEAFLEKFVESGAYGVITTHYGNLKNFANHTEGVVNAAMQFDPQTLSPSYQIQTGIPGRSYAFEIARKVGIPGGLIERAREKMDMGEVITEDLLLKLETQKAELEGVLKENKEKNRQLKELLEHNRALNLEVKASKDQILRKARAEADSLIKLANSKIENTIREIREIQAEKEKTKVLRQELQELLPSVAVPEEPEAVEEPLEEEEDMIEEIPGKTLEAGDWVKIRDSESYGKLLEIQDKRGVVALGNMRVTVKLKQLVLIRPPQREGTLEKAGTYARMSAKLRSQVSSRLDVKGMRVEQALPIVGKFMDDAIPAGLRAVRILHGKGTGALREAIRQFLKKYPEITAIHDEDMRSGGSGWTVIEIG